MTIVFTCICGRTLQVPEAIPGRKARCPGCGRRSPIPIADEQVAARCWRRPVIASVLLLLVVGALAGVTLFGLFDPGSVDEVTPPDGLAVVLPPDTMPPTERARNISDMPKGRDEAKAAPQILDRIDDGESDPASVTPLPASLLEAAPSQSQGRLAALPKENPEAKEDDSAGRLAKVPETSAVPPSVVDPPRQNKPGLVWSLPPQSVFWQEVQVSQNSAFRMPGLESPMTTSARYVIVSRLTVAKEEADDSATIHQRIEAARLEEADDVTRSVLAPTVRDLVGRTYTLTLNPQREVVRIDGEFSPPRTASLGGIGFVQVGLIDRDGWKELHQATFFQPNRVVRPGDRWTRDTTHSWGALGDWNGKTHYVYTGNRGQRHRVDYRYELVHAPSARTITTSPVPIDQAVFRHQPSGGTIWFDGERGRVVAVEERFHVRGLISLSILGQNLPVQMEEVQTFRLTVHDREPSGR